MTKHPNEPDMETLETLRNELLETDPDYVRKLEAIESQIRRRKAVKDPEK